LEAALALLENTENEQIYDYEPGDLLDETRSYLSEKMCERLGLDRDSH
jgi:hypothetical protein